MKTKTAINKMYWWLIALMRVQLASSLTWFCVEKIQQSGRATLHLVMAVAVGGLFVFQAPTVASHVARWIEGGTAPKQQKS